SPPATLPTTRAAAEHDLEISRAVASFALPLGASVNRAGSALFQAAAILFVARLYGIALGLPPLVQAGAAVFLASLPVAAVPSGTICGPATPFAGACSPSPGPPVP